MNAVGVVFAAEFERRLLSRAFIVGTLIGTLAIAGLAFLPSIFNGFSGSANNLVLVGDPALVKAAAKELGRDFTIVATAPSLTDTPTIAYLDAHRKAAAVVVLERRGDRLHVVAYTRDPGALRRAFTSDLGRLQMALAMGIPQGRIDALMRVSLKERDVAGKFNDPTQALAAQGIAYVFVMLLYLAILLSAQQIVLTVAEEKTSRIAELLVATIDPAQLLFAKVLAATATGFVQLAVWVTTAAAVGKTVAGLFADTPSSAASAAGDAAALGITAPEILWFIVFFVVGFTQCAVLFAAAGSLVNRSEDVGSVTGPLYIPIIGALVIAQLALKFPNAPQSVVFSMLPVSGPFVMFTRLIVSAVPVWQIALSLAINVLAAGALAWLGGRVYRVGLLLYGRMPTPRQIAAAMRQR